MNFLSPRPTWLWPTLITKSGYGPNWALNLPAVETNIEPWYSTIPQSNQLTTHEQVNYPGLLPTWKVDLLRETLRTWKCFLCTQCSCQNYHIRTHRMPYFGTPHSFASNQGICSQRMKLSNGPRLMEFTGLTIFPTTPKQLTWYNCGMGFLNNQ